MKNSDIIIITATDLELLEDLQDWLKSDFEILPVEKQLDTKDICLGDSTSSIAVVINFIQNNLDKLIASLKNWFANYNKDFELTFENGDKKATIKCPAKRITDDQMEESFSALAHFFD